MSVILVTGATGHLGNVLVRELLALGKKVRALVLPGEDCRSLDGLAVERVEGNILDESSLPPAFAGVEQVYHLAGLVSIMPGQEDLLRRVNVEGTLNVLRAARRANVRRLVYTSSIHALARPLHGVTIDESLPFDPANPAGAYDRTKAAASLAVLAAAKEGLDAVIVCPTGVIGPYDYRRSEIGEVILTWLRYEVSFLPDGCFDFVDVRDVARGHILAAERGRRGETYILGGERVHVRSLYEMVRAAIGKRARVIRVPMGLAMLAARLAEACYRIGKMKPRFTCYALETLISNSAISSEKARRELGYSPRPLAETVRDTVAWWLQHRQQIKPSLRTS